MWEDLEGEKNRKTLCNCSISQKYNFLKKTFIYNEAFKKDERCKNKSEIKLTVSLKDSYSAIE